MVQTEHAAPEDEPVTAAPGVGPARAEALGRLGVRTVRDLLLTLPVRHEDRRRFVPIRDLAAGVPAVVRGTVEVCGTWRRPYAGDGFEAHVADATGRLRCVWFNAGFLRGRLRTGTAVILYGKPVQYRGRLTMQHPEVEVVPVGRSDRPLLNLGRIVPVYPLTVDLSQRVMRGVVAGTLAAFADRFAEVLPAATREKHALPGIGEALVLAHFPDDPETAVRARARLVFEEFMVTQIMLAAWKIRSETATAGHVHDPPGRLTTAFLAALPFPLTGAQRRAIAEIERDMARPAPMHRLLQGDVGSGKTVVAAVALLRAVETGRQAAVMAPTEILADQHFRTFRRHFDGLGIAGVLLKGEMRAADRARVLAGIRSGEARFAVGTHALLEPRVAFARLGLIVIDEQHKFGVEQRSLLYGKGTRPDVLVMTATPIPRTLAMTVYGDLDVSVLDEMPPNRGPVVTRVIGEELLPKAFEFVRAQARRGRQSFVVCPLVSETRSGLHAAVSLFNELRRTHLAGVRVALIHGRMPSERKTAVMEEFRGRRTDVLVASTVVEVGMDVPDATIMLILNAERFGLAQLHQLRGRIGRGTRKSFCIVQGSTASGDAWRRLRLLAEHTDGFRIAEEDLKMRGMGNLLGREQSGVPPYRVGDPVRDADLLERARAEAFRLAREDPRLARPEHQALRRRAVNVYRAAGCLLSIG